MKHLRLKVTISIKQNVTITAVSEMINIIFILKIIIYVNAMT